ARRPLDATATSTCDAGAVAGDRAGYWGALADEQARRWEYRADGPGPWPSTTPAPASPTRRRWWPGGTAAQDRADSGSTSPGPAPKRPAGASRSAAVPLAGPESR